MAAPRRTLAKTSNPVPKAVTPAIFREPGPAIQELIFFSLFFVYLWVKVDLRLIYSAGTLTNFPVFYKGWAFFLQCLSQPGGLVDYASAFFSQLFYFSWAGALVVTLQAWVMGRCTGYVLARTDTPGARWLRFAPPALVLVTYVRYSYHFPTTMAFLVSLLLACLDIGLVSKLEGKTQGRSSATGSALLSLVVFVVVSIAAYAATAGAYWLFVALCVLYESLRRQRWPLGLGYVLLAVLISYTEGLVLFGASALDAYSHLLPVSWETRGWPTRERTIAVVYALYLLLPVTIVLWRVLRMSARALSRLKPPSRSPAVSKGRKGPARRWSKRIVASVRRLANMPVLRWTVKSAALLAIAGVIVLGLHDVERQTLLGIHYYACRQMWPEVLETARSHPTTHLAATNAVDRALYHTGRLGYDLFSFSQHPNALLRTGDRQVLVYWHKFDTFIDLGLMNLAEKNLAECMATIDAHPFILKRLALVNLVKGRTGAARVYLGALTKTLFHAPWARDYIARLRSDPNLTSDARVGHLRAVRIDQDYTAGFFAREKMLEALLEGNRQNRMAFEYLMTWYLLTRQLDKFISHIERLNDFDYPEVPRLYQEAMCIYMYGTRQPLRLPGRTLDPDIRRQIEDFSRIYNSHGRDKRAALPELAGRYGNSYFFYHIYGFVPGRE